MKGHKRSNKLCHDNSINMISKLLSIAKFKHCLSLVDVCC